MKKTLAALCAIAAIGVSAPAFADEGDAFSNAKANFVVNQNRNFPTASAYAIINWAKGANKWVVTGEIMDARPDTYVLVVGKAGTCAGQFVITTFTTDGTGYATFGAEIPYHENPTFPTDYNIVRIFKASGLPGCNTELASTAASGLLKFRGLNRLDPGADPATQF